MTDLQRDELAAALAKLHVGTQRRHVFLCVAGGKCAPVARSEVSWDYLKRRFKELGLQRRGRGRPPYESAMPARLRRWPDSRRVPGRHLVSQVHARKPGADHPVAPDRRATRFADLVIATHRYPPRRRAGPTATGAVSVTRMMRTAAHVERRGLRVSLPKWMRRPSSSKPTLQSDVPMPNAIRVHQFGGPEVLSWETVEARATRPRRGARAPHGGRSQFHRRLRAHGAVCGSAADRPRPRGRRASSKQSGNGIRGVRSGSAWPMRRRRRAPMPRRRVVDAERLVPVPEGVSDRLAAAALLRA